MLGGDSSFFPANRKLARNNEMIVAFAKRKWSAWSFSFLSSFLPYLVRLSFGFGARLRLISIFQPAKEEKGIPLLLFLFFCLRLRNLCFFFLFFYLCFFLAARAERSLVSLILAHFLMPCAILSYLTCLPTHSLHPHHLLYPFTLFTFTFTLTFTYPGHLRKSKKGQNKKQKTET